MKMLRKTRYHLFLGLLSAGVSSASFAQQAPPGLQIRSLPSAQAAIAPGAAVPPTTDPRVLDLLQRFSVATPGATQTIAASPSAPQKPGSVAALQARAGSEVEVHFRSNTGTPRLIEGKRLEPATATSSMPSGRDDLSTARSFLRNNKELLRLDDPDSELSLSKSEDEPTGQKHLRFAQQYEGIPVWPAEVGIHLDVDGSVSLMTGAYVPTPTVAATRPELTQQQAIDLARQAAAASSAARTSAELIIYAPGEQTPRLAWKASVKQSSLSDWLVVVDAENGTILTAYNQVYEGAATGTGTDLFGQTKSLHVWEQNGTFYLCDTSKQMFDANSAPPELNTVRGALVIQDAQNQPANNAPLFDVTAPNADGFSLPAAVSGAITLSAVYDFYLTEFNRNSYDGKGTNIPMIVRVDSNLNNAFFGNGVMHVGDADRFAGAYDVVAHEVSHGVTQSSSNLIYQNQPGAINESFSDILGEMAEFKITGSNDWILGTNLNQQIRDMKNPAHFLYDGQHPYPSKMSEYVNLDISRDKGGVHTNSSIINHCYYLVTEGLNGGIGRKDAEQIFYRANTVYLMQNSQFVDMRLACLRAAEDLFGANSAQKTAVAAAFDAVEIFDAQGAPAPPTTPPVQASDSTLFVYGTPNNGYLVGRREAALNDGTQGRLIGGNLAAPRSPAVNGDGTIGIYVTADHDASVIRTDGQGESKVGSPGVINSVAISADAKKIGLVLLDANGQPDHRITVFDYTSGTGQAQTYDLQAPTNDGGTTNTVQYADTMVFTSDGRYIVYDALNAYKLASGGQARSFSIYVLDTVTGAVNVLVPPLVGYDVGNPSLGRTGDRYLTFEATNQSGGGSTILTADVIARVYKAVGTSATVGYPKYNGADDTVVYAEANNQASSGLSLVSQALAADHLTPSGQRALWLPDGGYGSIYRRGKYQPAQQLPAKTGLANISTRLSVATGERVLIGGFILTGQDAKQVILRGLGPSLGVGGALADPTLELHDGSGATVAANDNWKDSQQADIQNTGIAPKNDSESAIVRTLNPGAYTALLAGKAGSSGIGLVELYDLARLTNSSVANISTRGFVDIGDNVMIGGLIVGQGSDQGVAKVAIRAIGPSLGASGVSGALQDPILELHDKNGATVATNDDWKVNAQNGQSQEAAVRATGIAPNDDRESALVETLAPGAYTAVVRGKNNSVGVALVEVYNLQ